MTLPSLSLPARPPCRAVSEPFSCAGFETHHHLLPTALFSPPASVGKPHICPYVSAVPSHSRACAKGGRKRPLCSSPLGWVFLSRSLIFSLVRPRSVSEVVPQRPSRHSFVQYRGFPGSVRCRWLQLETHCLSHTCILSPTPDDAVTSQTFPA